MITLGVDLLSLPCVRTHHTDTSHRSQCFSQGWCLGLVTFPITTA